MIFFEEVKKMNQLKQGLKRIADQYTGKAMAPVVDPNQFNDPLAAQTEWSQKLKGQVMFRTHKRKADGGGDILYHSTILFRIMTAAAILLGGGLFALALPDPNLRVFAVLFGVVTLAGFYMLVFKLGPIGFHSGEREFRRGWGPTRLVVPFDRIHALQLLTKVARDQSSDQQRGGPGGATIHLGRSRATRYVTSHELNLVLDDGQRENVLTFQDSGEALKDAETIAALVGVPVWNGMDHSMSHVIYQRPLF